MMKRKAKEVYSEVKNNLREEAGHQKSSWKSVMEVLLVSAKLGVTSFGGPIAHLGYFHNEYIRRRKWMDEQSYADLVALCQFLPGPASSQVGIGIGIMRAGLWGGVAAWLGFTLPSVLALLIFAFTLQGVDSGSASWIHGLKLVAVAIVAHAVWGMGQKLAPDRTRVTIAITATAITLLWHSAWSQVTIMILAGIAGLLFFRQPKVSDFPEFRVPISRALAIACWIVFFGLLLVLPILRESTGFSLLALFESFYRAGSLVFGGGHVVLPLLEREVIPTGWVTQEAFLTGYGATQAVPGPLFTFATYLGALIAGGVGAIVATIAIFLPAFLLVIGALPFWNSLRRNSKIQGMLIGVNAAVVGILLAALYNPIWTSTILAPMDFIVTAILFIMLEHWKLPPWLVVVTGALYSLL
ncbi:chromate transporter [Brevibacillus brevis]|uniref:chromate transporter n=1 Tax=Brevibacillus brevis TaxID=1393 RepID=UPI001F28CF0E|nr:chromate transporter [Brevibacillus brevis]UIO41837.1 chromate transporter [Brevibacillus brevis]